MRTEQTRRTTTERQSTADGKAEGAQLRKRVRNPETLAEFASVCKGFRVVIKELLTELGRKDYTFRDCKRCGLFKEHSPKGRYCRECWRRWDKQREIDYKAGFKRPRAMNGKNRDAHGRYRRVYVRKAEP